MENGDKDKLTQKLTNQYLNLSYIECLHCLDLFILFKLTQDLNTCILSNLFANTVKLIYHEDGYSEISD